MTVSAHFLLEKVRIFASFGHKERLEKPAACLDKTRGCLWGWAAEQEGGDWMKRGPESYPGLQLCYQLEENELLECFSCLDSPKQSRARLVNEAILLLLACLFAVLYALNPAAVHYAVLVAALLLTCLAIRHIPPARRRRKARRMARHKGTYRLEIHGDGRVKGADTPLLEIDGNGCRFYESHLVYTLLLGKGYCFCIPKRVLTASQQTGLHHLLLEKGLVMVAADFVKNRKGR